MMGMGHKEIIEDFAAQLEHNRETVQSRQRTSHHTRFLKNRKAYLRQTVLTKLRNEQ